MKKTLKNKKEDKRERIVEAAKKVFSKYGYNKSTLEDIGKIVGMKKNSLYHYFSNKEELFAFIIDREANAYFQFIDEEVEKGKTSEEKIKIVVKDGIKFSRKRLNLYNATVAARAEIFTIIENFHADFVNKQVDIITKLLQRGIKNKEFAKHNYKILAKDIIDMIHSIEEREYSRSDAKYLREINFEQVDSVIINLLSFILKGLNPKLV